VTVTPPGFVNVRIDSAALVSKVLGDVSRDREAFGSLPQRDERVVIEHTNMNPNKAAHIGHVRNACLGDCLVRIMRRCGYRVEVQNYVDDTGAQVADVVLGMRELGAKPPPGVRFDHFCWDLYTDVNRRFEAEPELKAKQAEYLHLIERGEGEVAELAKDVAERVLEGHLRTMWGLGIYYDLLSWESDIVRRGFWRHAFAELKREGSIVYEESGPNAGCWVVPLRNLPEFQTLANPDKILVRSNGTATYVAKDIAYQLWKFGVLGLDFEYRFYGRQADGSPLYASCPPGQAERLPEGVVFGRADRVVNVIDIRQKYLQDVLRHSLRQLGYKREADRSVHFAYEVVALSPETARELGLDVSRESKGVYAMAGRKGIGVKADDLLAAAEAKAKNEVLSRHPEMGDSEAARLAHDIAVAAVRYYMVRFNTNTLIAFDFDEALAMHGHTGPYLQYAQARALSILRKARQTIEGCPDDPDEALSWAMASGAFDERGEDWPAASERALALTMADFSPKLVAAAEHYLPSIVADYSFSLATCFTDFYEALPVLAAKGQARVRRVGLVGAFVRVMRNAMETLGLPAPAIL
jgi:arginyl-tRNA synthetase